MKPVLANGNLIAALDVGGSKVCCFVARLGDDGQLQMLGVGHQLSRGIRGGVITDVEEAQTSILAAVHAAEEMAGMNIEEVLVGVTLPEMQSRRIRVELALGSDAVGDRDLADILREGQANVTAEEHLLHSLPISFALDNNRNIHDPRGMLGERLVSDLLLITAPANLLRNLSHCIGRCHLEVAGYVAAPYASALAVLEEDEKDLGATLIDLGGSVTGYAVFSAGKMIHLGNVPLGANHVTQDIAVGLTTSIQQAERLKTMHGSAIISPADDEVMIEVPELGNDDEDGNTVPRSSLIHIIRPRLEEIFELVRDRIDAAGLAHMSGNRVVITGGGSQIIGINDLAKRILGKQARTARAREVEGLADAVSGPAFSTAIGMLHYAIIRRNRMQWSEGKGGSFRQRLVNWFRNSF